MGPPAVALAGASLVGEHFGERLPVSRSTNCQSADPEYEPAQIARAVITTGLFWGDEDTEDKAAVCGESPVDVPDRAVLEWVVERCRYGDAIIEHGIAFVLVQPVIEPTGA